MEHNVSLNKFLIQLGLEKVVFFKDEEGVYSSVLHFDTQNKLKLINPDAIYIFNNQPLILFFDLTDNTDSKREDDIHKKVWSFDNSPIAFVIKNAEIKVYNALNYIKNEKRLEEIEISSEGIRDRFSFWNLQSNNIWKWFQEEYIETTRKKESKKRVNERLFQNIRDVRNTLIDKTNDPEGSIPNSLILRLIFIRYLIDRNIEIGTEFIDGEDTLSRRLSFSKLLQDPDKLCQLFTKLNDRFNGVLFKDVDIKLTTAEAEGLSDIFKGEIPKKDSLFYGSDFYFEIFDFSIIPVEVISGIYESLIDPETRNRQSAVYTPSFLVEYILNDTVDVFLNENKASECKIFEVAVGSGIFLVQSLRKMIEKEIELNGNLEKEAFSERIRNIAKRNLYGVDINREALKVTCFSIYIALLDYQEPKDVDIYRFPNLLGENLFEANFFDVEHEFNQIINEVKPQFILGNPPWKNGGKDKVHTTYLRSNNLSNIVSDFQLAQSFILRTKDFSDYQPICSLIISSKAIYNNNAVKFKEKFLTDFKLIKCFDLSAIRRLVFEKANNPAMILQYQHAKGNNTNENEVIHQSLKNNIFIKNFRFFSFEKGDIKRIRQKYFSQYKWMFKAALYGSSLDFCLLKKLTSTNTIDYVLSKEYSIKAGNGIHKGTPKRHYTDLIGLPIIETQDIQKYYTKIREEQKILEEEDVFLEAGRDVSLFKGEKILLTRSPKDESFIIASYCKEDVVFRNSVYGIPLGGNTDLAKYLFAIFNSKLFTYYQYLFSSNWGVYYPIINKTEYLSFPFLDSNQFEDEVIKTVTDFIQSFIEKEGNTSVNQLQLEILDKIVDNIYSINEYEKDIIDYALNISRFQFQGSKQHLITDFTYLDENHYRNQTKVLRNYAEVFLNEFGKIYEGEYIQVEVYPLRHFIAMNFTFHENAVKDVIIYPDDKFNEVNVFEKLGDLSISQITNTTDPTKNLFIQKDIKGFEANSFYVIKPKEYKCWHRAMAWYDVAEFKAKIEEVELNHLNNGSNE
ncbi:MAG: hypothetical protein LBV43_03170 [Prevotella sp.]|jgi:hypothetical protein|nr:hypothetical protein [Prevotella sp.]